VHEGELGIQLLQARIFGFEVLDAFEFVDREATVLGLPVIEGSVADAKLATQVGNFLSALIALQHGDDLGFGESGFFHRSEVGYFPLSTGPIIREAYISAG
jgi:hypothetical protein